MKAKKVIKIALLVVVLVVIGLGVKNQATKYYLNQHKKDMINLFMYGSVNEEGHTFKEVEEMYEEDVNFYYTIEPQNDMIYVDMYDKNGDGYMRLEYKVDTKNEICELVYSSED